MALIPFPTTSTYFNGTRTATIRALSGGVVSVIDSSDPTDWIAETGQAAIVNLQPVAAVDLAGGQQVQLAEIEGVNNVVSESQIALAVRGYDSITGSILFEADSLNSDLSDSNDNQQFRGMRVILKDLRLGPWKGLVLDWSAITAYVIGDLVFRNGLAYSCILGHTNQAPPNATYWVLYTFDERDRISYTRGATTYGFVSLVNANGETPFPSDWSSGAVGYVVGNEVFYLGSTFRCTTAHTSAVGLEPLSRPDLWKVYYSTAWTLRQYTAELTYGTTKVSYVFAYRLVNDWNEAGPLSDPVSLDADYGQTVSLHGHIDQGGTAYVGYRQGFAGYKLQYFGFVSDSVGGGEYRLIHQTDEFGTSGTAHAFGHWITNKPADWAEEVGSNELDVPPEYPLAIAPGPNGMIGLLKEAYFAVCEPYKGHAWPVRYRIPLPYKGVGMLAVAGGWLITTVGKPYFIAGPIPEQLALTDLPLEQAGISQKSMCSLGGAGTAYASNDGIVVVQGLGMTLATGTLFTRKEWRARYGALLSKMRLAYHDGRLVCLFPGTDEGEASNYQGFIIRFDERGGPQYSRMSLTGSAVAIDPLNDQLLFGKLVDGVWGFCVFEEGAPLPLTWQSKEFIVPRPANMACGMIDYTDGPLTVDVHADGVNVLTTTIPYSATRTEVIFRLPPDRMSQRWSVYVTEGVYLAWNSGTTYAIGDGVSYGGLNYRALTANVGFQPDVSTSDWVVIGGETVHRILLATSMMELTKA